MTNSIILAGIFVLTVALALACTPPEPVVKQVEVTRQVEVAVAVPQTVEVKVPFPQTRIVEQTVEVTREVPITVVVTATPPAATPTPTPAPMPTIEPTLTYDELAQAELFNVLIALSNDDDDLVVEANTAFVADTFDLDILVDGQEYCNSNRIYPDDGFVELGCKREKRPHRSVDRVSIQTPYGDLRCAKDTETSNLLTFFTCVWR